MNISDLQIEVGICNFGERLKIFNRAKSCEESKNGANDEIRLYFHFR